MTNLNEAADALRALQEIPLLLEQTKIQIRQTDHALSNFNATARETVNLLTDLIDNALHAALALERVLEAQSKVNGQ